MDERKVDRTRPPAGHGRTREGEGHPTSTEHDLTGETWEFVRAMEAYKKKRRRPFPSFSECLQVAVSLGYRRVAEPEPLPGVTR